MTSRTKLTLNRLTHLVVVLGLVLSVLGTPMAVPVARAQSPSAPVNAPVDAPKPGVTPVVETTPTPEATPVVEPVTAEPVKGQEPVAPAPVSIEFDQVPAYTPPVSGTLQQLDHAGGRVVSTDKRIQLNVPAGLFKAATQVSITPRGAEKAKGPAGLLFQFDLQAQDLTNEKALTTFERPITLTVDLNGLIDRSQLKPYEHLAIFYKTDNPDAPWSELKGTHEIAKGVMQVSLRHFSTYAAGSSGDAPAGWHLKYNPPAISTFSGAATFNYPIEVAPGRTGLQPEIVLSYNTRSVDGVVNINTEDSDGVPFGWSLDMASISRDGTNRKYHATNDTYTLDLRQRFSISINGTNHDLIPAGQPPERYYAKDAPNLYIERHNPDLGNGTTSNISHEYWIVKTGDGKTYRFGYNSDSEQTQGISPAFMSSCIDGGYCGALGGPSGNTFYAGARWRVDQITDVYSNTIVFAYATSSTSEDGWGEVESDHTRPIEIKYNYTNGIPASRIQFYNSQRAPDQQNTVNWFDRIYVYNAGEANKIREYQLGWDEELKRLLSIAQVNGAGNQSLPATTFTYADLRKDWWNINFTPYLTRIDNGYNGATEFSYLEDGRYHSAPGKVVLFGYSHRVSEVRTYDGINPNPAKVQYEYGTPCYDQYGGSGLAYCRGQYPEEDGPLVGHQWTKQTTFAYDGTELSSQLFSYNIDDNNSSLRGRELRAQTLDASDNLLAQVDSIYSTQANGATTFTYLSDQTNTTWNSGIPQTKRTSSSYDGYGHLAAQYDYGAEEKIINAGFENGIANWVNTNSQVMFTTTPADALSGRSSLALQGEAGTIYQSLTGLTPNITYTVRLWIKATPDNGDQFQIHLHDDIGQNYFVSNPLLPATTWTEVRLDYRPNTRGTLLIELVHLNNASSNGATYVDEVALAQTLDVGDERSTYMDYIVNANPNIWIVDQPKRESVYNGIWLHDSNLNYLLARTRYRYDGQCLNDLPTRGALTAVDRWNGQPGTSSCDDPVAFLTTKTSYDSWGNPTIVTDTRGFTTTTAYDGQYHMYPVRVSNALAQSTQYQYYGINGIAADGQPIGLLKRTVDPNGAETTYTYDGFGRLLETYQPGDNYGTAAADPSIRYRYYDANQLLTPNWPLLIAEVRKPASANLGIRHFYDGLGREIQTHTAYSVTLSGTTSRQDVIVSRQVDARGLIVSETVPYSVPAYVGNSSWPNPYTTVGQATAPKTLTQYDALGRVIQTTNPDGTSTAQSYYVARNANDGDFRAGRVSSNIIDANGHIKRYSYDGRGQLRVVTEFMPDTEYRTHYTYDALGNLTKVRDTLGNTTIMTYNVMSQKIGMSDPDMGVWSYQYDLAGNLITQTDALNQVLWFNYDPLNRLTAKRQTNSSGPLLASYTYGSVAPYVGYRLRMDDPSGYTLWAYDNRGRVTQETKAITDSNMANVFVTGYGYDVLDRVITTTYPTGEVVTQTYNSMGTLENVRSSNTAQSFNQWYVPNLDYNANGSIARLDLDNGATTLYGYFGLTGNQWDVRPGVGLSKYGRLWRSRTEVPSGAVLQDLRYNYDNVGNVTNIRDLPQAITGILTTTIGDGFNAATLAWTLTGNVTIPYNDGVNKVAKITATKAGYADNLARTNYNLVTNTGVQVKFKVDSAAADFVIGIENSDTIARRLAIYGDGTGRLRIQYNDGATPPVWRYPVVLTPTIQGSTWYTLTFLVDDVRGHTVEVSTSATGARYIYNIGLATGQQWRLHAWAGSGSLFLDDYREFTTDNGAVVTPDEGMTFTYDALDRVQSANKTTNDGYTQSYGYNGIGNIITTSTALNIYTYTASATGCVAGALALKPHAVSQAGRNSYQYDCNGNMKQRVENSVIYNQTWTPENRVATISGNGQTAQYIYDGDGNRVKKVQGGKTLYIVNALYEEERSHALELRIQSNGTAGNSYNYRFFDTTTTYVIQNGDQLEFDEYLGSSNPQFVGGFDAELSSAQPVRDISGWVDQNGLSIHPGTDLSAYARGQWYHRVFAISNKAGQTLSAFKIAHEGDAGGTYVIRLDNVKVTNGGVTQKVIYEDGALISNLQAEGPTWDIISQILSANIVHPTSYYFAGSQRVAMRQDGNLYYFVADHLGSTSVTLDASGNKISEQKYYPFGETRSGSSPTDRQFTGQRAETGLGNLYDYNARFYSPILGRFISADTMVPKLGNPQAWNRYSYGYNNPLRYNDPTGHCGADDIDKNTDKCIALRDKLQSYYWITILGEWTLAEMLQFQTGLQNVESGLGGREGFIAYIGRITVNRIRTAFGSDGSTAHTTLDGSGIEFFDDTFKNGHAWSTWTTIHEAMHVIDNKHGHSLTLGHMGKVGASCQDGSGIDCHNKVSQTANGGWAASGPYNPGPESPFTAYGTSGAKEDMAETLTAAVFNGSWVDLQHNSTGIWGPTGHPMRTAWGEHIKYQMAASINLGDY